MKATSSRSANHGRANFHRIGSIIITAVALDRFRRRAR